MILHVCVGDGISVGFVLHTHPLSHTHFLSTYTSSIYIGNVMFADGNTVKRLLVGMGTPLPSEDQMQALDLQDPNSAVYMWYKVFGLAVCVYMWCKARAFVVCVHVVHGTWSLLCVCMFVVIQPPPPCICVIHPPLYFHRVLISSRHPSHILPSVFTGC